MTVIRTLLFLGAACLMLAEVNGAPAKYDQRQEGDFNLHAQLENFLFVIAIPSSGSGSSNELLSDLALQALEFKQQLSSRSSSSKEQESIKSEEVRENEKPYTLEVIRISEKHPDEGNLTRGDEQASNVSDLQFTLTNSKQGAGPEPVGRVAKDVKGFEFPKNRVVPAILGYFVDTGRVPVESKAEDGGRARNVLEDVRSPDVDPDGKPGTSLKKQLFRKREEDIAPSPNAHEDDTGLIPEKKQQELRLLGDAIENCGPGRRRDAAGNCQFDEFAGSLL
ncbi:hypothetical protein DMN91_012733 [Ooceraea biroi]|uniref:Uncharacterized protein n=1 Tax=Ooceraea biroi TaxID=2015173 RepID=A0A026VYE7_OOCBI|nr:uncharacterized protein LOC113563367 [Ooceraea biroi]EZA48486.1 hypothetical protein X777_12980 [Ooceraea biroi]RLU14846.1 hypothetical protein DMN91_012733 [Ooceraea biroi]